MDLSDYKVRLPVNTYVSKITVGGSIFVDSDGKYHPVAYYNMNLNDTE